MSKIYNRFEKFLFNRFEKNGCLTPIVVLFTGWYLIYRLYSFFELNFPVLIIFTPLIIVIIHFYLLGDTKSRNEKINSESFVFICLLYFIVWMGPLTENQMTNNPPENNPLIHFLSLLPDWLPFWEDVRFNVEKYEFEPGYYYNFNYYSLDFVHDHFYLSVFIFHIMIIYVVGYMRYWVIELLKNFKN